MRAGPVFAAFPVVAVLCGTGCELIAPPPPPDEEPTPGFVISQPFPDVRALLDVTVLSADPDGITLAYAAGSDGAVLRYDGKAWTEEFTGVDGDLQSISGFIDNEGAETVLAVGDGGLVLQRIEGRWGQLTSPVTSTLFSVWVRRPDDAFIAGESGKILRWDGLQVTEMVNESLQERTAVDASGNTTTEYFPIPEPLKGVSGRGSDVWAVGARGAVYAFNADDPNSRWRRETSGTSRPLADVFTRAGVWAPTTDGVLLRRNDDGSWDDQSLRTPAPIYLQAMWARGGSDLYAVGLDQSIFSWDGGAWSITAVEDSAEIRAVDGISLPLEDGAPEDAIPGRQLFAVAGGGRIIRGPLVLALDGENLLTTRLAETEETQ